ncbi:cation diffusion facilitator family transporter [bacterium]|nr:MAG: cation diffusion facilitator family transporter [bacterium]
MVFLVAFVVGLDVHSVSLLLDAAASLVILVVALLVRFSIRKIRLPPDDIHNFGYGKYERLTVVAQGFMIIAICIVSIKFAIQDIIHLDDVHSYMVPTIATFLSGILGIFITVYIKKSAVKTNSDMLKASGMHWHIDTILSFGVCAGFLIGFILQVLGFYKITPYVDPVMALILSLILLEMPIKAIMRSVPELLDIVPAQHIKSKVKEVVEIYMPKSFGVHRLRTRKAGERVFVDVCFLVKPDMTVLEAEELSKNFELDLTEHLPYCDVVVYFKPV